MNAPAGPCPHVYLAINRIIAAFAKDGIARNNVNIDDGYEYRSIDDLLDRLAPLLARHRLTILPRVLQRQELDRSSDGSSIVSVSLHVAFDLVSARDGSSHVVEAYGEAWDRADKATSKASSAAFKSAMFQTFCIPLATDDPDRTTIRKLERSIEPPGGWTNWCDDLLRKAKGCGTPAALEHLRVGYSAPLNALRLERPDLYAKIGLAFTQPKTEIPADKLATLDA